jgi:hypothetical protein
MALAISAAVRPRFGSDGGRIVVADDFQLVSPRFDQKSLRRSGFVVEFARIGPRV